MKYTREQQKQFADALLTADPAIARLAIDYMKLRDKARACRGIKR